MKLVVGLGNPGVEYINTRHNIGFMFLDYFSNKHGFLIDKKKFNGLYAKTKLNNEEVIFLKPQSYMNLSGEVVKKFVDYYKIDLDDILIVSDDLDLDIGSYRLRAKGSSGGHNGLKNIALNLGTENFKRLKIGISNNKSIDTKNYVLGKIDLSIISEYNKLFDVISNILEDYLIINFNILMGRYNHK